MSKFINMERNNSVYSDDYSDNETEKVFGLKKTNSPERSLLQRNDNEHSEFNMLDFSMDSFFGSEGITSEQFTFKMDSFASKHHNMKNTKHSEFTFMNFKSRNSMGAIEELDQELLNEKECAHVVIDRSTHPLLFKPLKFKLNLRRQSPKL